MKLQTLGLVALLASCTVHNHFHAPAGPPTAPASPPPPLSVESLHENAGHHTVRGVVVDPEGTPVRARIAAVGANGGSYSTSTDDRGRFTIQPPFDEYVLHASTEGGLIALRPGRANSEHAQLELQPGAILVIDLAGREKTRCAIFAQHLRAEDFTLHAGRTARVAVPAGGVQVRLYEGGDVFAEQYFDVRVGESKSASFKLGS